MTLLRHFNTSTMDGGSCSEMILKHRMSELKESIRKKFVTTTLFSRWENCCTEVFIKVTQGVRARRWLYPDLLTLVLFCFGYTSVAQLSEVVRDNNGFQDNLRMIGQSSPFSGTVVFWGFIASMNVKGNFWKSSQGCWQVMGITMRSRGCPWGG